MLISPLVSLDFFSLFRQGPEWEIFRLNMMPYVFKHKMYHEMIDNVAGDLLKLIKVKRDDKGEVPDLMELTSRWALECKYTLVFSSVINLMEVIKGGQSDTGILFCEYICL